MDITEAFRSEDLSKADFFDFVITPDSLDANHLQFKPVRNNLLNNNNNNIVVSSDGQTTTTSKETNNNNLLHVDLQQQPVSTTTAGNAADNSIASFDSTFWGDKETVRIETAILEDLNKYCWSTDDGDIVKNNNNNNTDGHIYTLTVLNGVDQTATWYRPPNSKEDESISSPGSMEQLQAGLDIDSILNIMPGQLNGFSATFSNQDQGSSSVVSPNTDGLIKSETYSYEDSGFADNKDELTNALIIDTPLLEAHDNFNNNNDWKLTNNNVPPHSPTTTTSTADSLLRSALQGKAFVRYNGAANTNNSSTSIIVPTSPKTLKTSSDSNIELRRVLSTPTTNTPTTVVKAEPSPQPQTTVFIKQEEPDVQQQGNIIIPTIIATGIDANGTIIFEERIAGTASVRDSVDQTSSMDDMLLAQLDNTFGTSNDDYEKLKRIANEVAESVNQFCQIDSDTGMVESATLYTIREPLLLNDINSPVTITPIVTSTKPAAKKYKRNKSSASNNNNSSSSSTSATSTSANASSSSSHAPTTNGIRKERSLHYCSICTKGFKDKYSVNVHIRTHTGEKPFACSLCGKSFRQKAHLAKHYQTHVAQKNAAAASAASASIAAAAPPPPAVVVTQVSGTGVKIPPGVSGAGKQGTPAAATGTGSR